MISIKFVTTEFLPVVSSSSSVEKVYVFAKWFIIDKENDSNITIKYILLVIMVQNSVKHLEIFLEWLHFATPDATLAGWLCMIILLTCLLSQFVIPGNAGKLLGGCFSNEHNRC